MTPEQIAALTIAAMEHDGHQLSEADKREIQRKAADSRTYRRRFREMMHSPAYQWKKPASPRR
ncbi:hypothetical protein NMD69_01680 [Edwardsiella tarda]|nr:hypothetical protein [Edwardsiella piscicida]ARD18658.1 hypothetical protein BXA22_10060 [Edwardsiella piscicida]WLJ46310.1 hypothetical protein Q8A59_15295 [Edwardsiella piscicida]SPW33714.1 Uncharacterised protein [Edwardsiella tarda]